MGCCLVVHLLGRTILVKDPVEEISLLSASVEDVWLFALIFTFHLNSIEDQKQLVFCSDYGLIVKLNLPFVKRSDSDCDHHIAVSVVFVQKLLGRTLFAFLYVIWFEK